LKSQAMKALGGQHTGISRHSTTYLPSLSMLPGRASVLLLMSNKVVSTTEGG